MIKFNSLKTFGYNWLEKVKYNNSFNSRLIQLLTRTGPRPIVLNKEGVQVAVLENSFNVIVEQEVKGIDEITFSLPMTDSKRELLQNEGFIQMFDDIYVIREIIDRKKSQTTEVYAEAIWYDLQYTEPLVNPTWETKTAAEMMAGVLEGTGWRVGNVALSNKRSLSVENVEENRLGILRRIEDLFQGELWFNTQDKTVDLLENAGFETGAAVTYEKNADDIEAYYDTRELVTKIYLYGAENMTIADANEGIEYLENYSYSKNKRVQIIKDERYKNPFQLKEMGEKALAEISKPRASYSIKMGELTERQGLEHEKFVIGGIVRVYDKELKLNIDTRIMKWRYNVIEPWKTTFDLETKAKTLSELLTGSDSDVYTLMSEDALADEMINMSVFNLLMNSRADDGFSYWTNTGWEIDPLNGNTGGASFKARGNGTTKELFQTVYPSSSDDYSISFRANMEDLVAEEGDVGVEITITYEDDSKSDPIFIKLV